MAFLFSCDYEMERWAKVGQKCHNGMIQIKKQSK